VNGKMMQDGNTKNLVFNIRILVSYLSQFMTLLPGDVISTVLLRCWPWTKTRTCLHKNGDVIELGIEGLGTSNKLQLHIRNNNYETLCLALDLKDEPTLIAEYEEIP
jgi:2-keto-4-pentenoate hydratase/2-oxohepta-3-ene-1,7-dioic acid hydratase in catechol pathway